MLTDRRWCIETKEIDEKNRIAKHKHKENKEINKKNKQTVRIEQKERHTMMTNPPEVIFINSVNQYAFESLKSNFDNLELNYSLHSKPQEQNLILQNDDGDDLDFVDYSLL